MEKAITFTVHKSKAVVLCRCEEERDGGRGAAAEL